MSTQSEHPESVPVRDTQFVRITRHVTASTLILIFILAVCVLIALLLAIPKSDKTTGSSNTGNSTNGKVGTDGATNKAPASVNHTSGGNDGAEENKLSVPVNKDAPVNTEDDDATANVGSPEEESTLTGGATASREAAVQAPFSISRLPESLEAAPWRSSDGNLFSGRDVASRKKLVESGGGSSESEVAVGLGLDWLARHQHKDGHWSLDAFHQTPGCDGRCTMHGASSNTAGTALGVLPFLAHGNTHKDGKYHEQVSLAIDWLVHDLGKNGVFRSCGAGTMYAQGQGAIALCEILAMTSESKFRPHAKRAIDFIVSSQHSGGGWRYNPRTAGDTSVLGWQVLALQSAMQARLSVPKSTLREAARFLDSVQSDKSGATYGYMPGRRFSPAMSAEGLLSRIYTGWRIKHAGINSGTEYLLNNMPQTHMDIYYWYYATQVMHEYGGAEWDRWNVGIRDFLIGRQEQEGHARGSWPVAGGHDSTGGRLYATSLCLLTLQVYYRHTKGQ